MSTVRERDLRFGLVDFPLRCLRDSFLFSWETQEAGRKSEESAAIEVDLASVSAAMKALFRMP